MTAATTSAAQADVAVNPDTGLTFTRRNTRTGVDPYDQFEWTTHDVVMRNWRDQTINFEQRGVLFPSHWSDNAVSIVTSKYFRGAVGSPQREQSLRDVVERVVTSYRDEGLKQGYFASTDDAEIFADEMRYALVDQQFAFNSPVWFNVGTSSPWQVSACYILAVEDSMSSILDWYKEEGMIFKGGSGAGVNLSNLRSSNELLSSGGKASGPISFMRGADASAGTIKSGGATRRAAKMVVLDADHPDIREFVTLKANEEEKIRVLRDAGFDMDLGGADIASVQYQNANNSVRASDAFMEAVTRGEDWELTARTDGSTVDTVNARELMRQIAEAAWACADPGMQYDDEIQRWHTLPNEGRITASNPCSEFLHLDNSSCNLASARVTKFFDPETGDFDAEGFTYLTRLMMVAAEISVSFGHFPTETIGEVTRKSRPIGLGYTDLGALLMTAGVAYDSELGRSWAAGITSLLTAAAYETSAELARAVGPFTYFDANRTEMLAVIGQHKHAARQALDNAANLPRSGNLNALHEEAVRTWSQALGAGVQYGYRNSQAVVIAPTGTISFFMDSATTGIEPDLSLVKHKKIADGGYIQIVNQSVPAALKQLGYDPQTVAQITEHVAETGSILSAPGFHPEHAEVFACAMGDNVITPMGHVRMMAAVQPFVSGSISKTVNMPEEATVEDIEEVYVEGWRLGLKCIAIYRDNCKVGQPLSSKSSASTADDTAATASEPAADTPTPVRHRLPRQRQSLTTSFTIGDADGYIQSGVYPNGQMGELFLKMSKPGSTLAGVVDALAIAVSLGLQYGVPLEVYCAKFLNTKFEPAGMTNDPDVRFASSVLDLVFRRLALDHLPAQSRSALGVQTIEERTAAVAGTDPADADAAADADGGSAGNGGRAAPANEPASDAPAASGVSEHVSRSIASNSDAPMCFDCGVTMQRAGSCHVCPQCSGTSGCS